MDINDVRSLITVLAFVTFIGIVFWAWSGKRKQAFDEAAHLPFHEDEPDSGVNSGRVQSGEKDHDRGKTQ